MPELDETLGALDGEFGDRGVVLGGAVEGRGDNLTLDRALHVGDLFWTLIDENNHEVNLGVVDRDGVRDLLQNDRLACLGRSDDEAALSLADRSDQVDDALRELALLGLEPQAFLRVERRELAEFDAVRCLFDTLAVDGLHLDDGVVLLAGVVVVLTRLADRSDNGVTLAQVVLLDLAERDVDVVRAGQVAGRAHERVVVENVEDSSDRQKHVVVADLGLEVGRLGSAAALAVAVTVASVTAALVVAVLLAVAVAVAAGIAVGATVVAVSVAVGVAIVAGAVVAVALRLVGVAVVSVPVVSVPVAVVAVVPVAVVTVALRLVGVAIVAVAVAVAVVSVALVIAAGIVAATVAVAVAATALALALRRVLSGVAL